MCAGRPVLFEDALFAAFLRGRPLLQERRQGLDVESLVLPECVGRLDVRQDFSAIIQDGKVRHSLFGVRAEGCRQIAAACAGVSIDT